MFNLRIQIKLTRTTQILLIALCTVIVFSKSLKNNFVWDDKYLIVDNSYIKNWNLYPRIFTTQLYKGSNMQSNYYRPLQLLSYGLDYFIWGLRPFGYHLTNLLLHISNSTIVYLILLEISSSAALASLTAILFAIAPAISITTYYIASRADLLMTLFLLLSFLFFSRFITGGNKSSYVSSIILYILALFSREMAVILPALLILEGVRTKQSGRKIFRLIMPYLIIAAGYILSRFTILNFAGGKNKFIESGFPASLPLWERILTDFKILVLYIRLLLFPYGLHMERFIKPAHSMFQIEVVFSLVILIILTLAIKRIARFHKLVWIGALWFLISLSPVLNLYPLSVLFHEGWLYVPSIGFFIVAGVILENIIRPRIRKGFYLLMIIIVTYYAVFTLAYGKVWSNSVNLFTNILKYEKRSPFIYLTYNNLAGAYFDRGEFEKSIIYAKKSISLEPGYAAPYSNIAVAYMEMGQPLKAIPYFKKAISLKRDYMSAYTYLAYAYNYIGLRDRAIGFLKAALKVDPEYFNALCDLGYLYYGKHDIDTAISFFKKAARIKNENYEPHYCLGSLYLKKDMFKESMEQFDMALRFGLEDYKFYNKLAFLYFKNNKFKQAIQAFKKSIELNDSQSEPHNNLGNIYSMYGKYKLAIGEYKRALELDPHNLGILNNIRKTKKEWKETVRQRLLQSSP